MLVVWMQLVLGINVVCTSHAISQKECMQSELAMALSWCLDALHSIKCVTSDPHFQVASLMVPLRVD